MKILDYIIIIALGLWLAASIYSVIKNRSRGCRNCTGCSGGSCVNCSPKKAERDEKNTEIR